MAIAGLSGCSSGEQHAEFPWAVNVGGPAYTGVDGVHYVAEEFVSGGDVGQIEGVKGSQDEPLYLTYRIGDVRVDKPMANGLYDVILHFAEPDEIEAKERLFDVFINTEKRVARLDVMVSRDGKIRSGLTVAVPNVRVSDGRLQIEFSAISGEPILSAVVVRDKPEASDRWSLVWQDEFDYEGPPDATKWNVENWPARVVNDEDQAYTSRPKNVRVEDGYLVIEAHKEDYDNAKYTSARIQSQGKGDFLYGRIEARARLPRGMGTWRRLAELRRDRHPRARRLRDGPRARDRAHQVVLLGRMGATQGPHTHG